MNKQLILDPPIEELLDQLYARHEAQNEEMTAYFTARAKEGSLSWKGFDERTDRFLQDKLVALDRDKAEFCYQVCRSLGARRVVEVGTSFGVSTLFLAAAVRDTTNGGSGGVVIGTEYEPEKAKAARSNFATAELSEFIELREGDLRKTLVDIGAPIDFMLIDIWTPMARPAVELVAPHLREGAVVICDNTLQFQQAYGEYFEFINNPANRFRTMTLPFQGGLEFTVRCG